jgi:hypothetical protein
MLIITHDIKSSGKADEFESALRDLGALHVTPSTWLLPGTHLASSLMEMLEPLLPDKDADALFIGALDAFAELQWTNTLCSDSELGGLIRLVRESPPA